MPGEKHMPRLFYRRWMTALIGFGFLFTWSGYRSLAADSTPTPTLTVEPAATQEGTLAPLNVLFGPGTFKFPFPAAGLADLSSYRATLTLTFKGTNSGQSTQSTAWSRTYVMLTSQKPAARQLTINSSDSAATPVFTTEMSGVVYSHDGQNDCIATTAQQGNSLAERLESAGFLPGVIGAEGGSSETVNSVTASHYTFDERALGQKGITQSKGELWVATTGGFLVKYRLVTTGGADYFGDGITGTISSDYELTDVNQPITINLPADCPAGMVDAPLMPDVTNVFKAPGLLSYSTVSSVTDVTAFYQSSLWLWVGRCQAHHPLARP